MFKFNFQVDPNDDGVLKFENEPEVEPKPLEPLECYESEKVGIESDIIDNMEVYRKSSTSAEFGSTEIQYVLSGNLKEILATRGVDIKRADEQHSDLLPGIYEGGAKIWECTGDFLRYLSKNCKRDFFKGKRVLDMGCGAGILGIYALKNDSIVEFQDYNKDVLQTITIPNVLLNLPASDDPVKDNAKRISFFSGDWSKYTEATKFNQKFDIILTCETIYNTRNYKKILETFKEKLKSGGKILLAGKVYYFGVGGGVQQFEDMLKTDGVFSSKSVWRSEHDVHREILEIRYKDDVE